MILNNTNKLHKCTLIIFLTIIELWKMKSLHRLFSITKIPYRVMCPDCFGVLDFVAKTKRLDVL